MVNDLESAVFYLGLVALIAITALRFWQAWATFRALIATIDPILPDRVDFERRASSREWIRRAREMAPHDPRIADALRNYDRGWGAANRWVALAGVCGYLILAIPWWIGVILGEAAMNGSTGSFVFGALGVLEAAVAVGLGLLCVRDLTADRSVRATVRLIGTAALIAASAWTIQLGGRW